ncbi:MAG TPA: LysR family transcriptional regulator [Dongiaceae bacterium]|jgi:DNA-binding transcriptional LysR family regulator
MDRLSAMRTYRAVVETGGFSAAARRLGLSKAAVSKQVAELEAHFGTALLVRTTRRLNATDAGRRYFENSVRLLDELNEVEAEVRNSQAEPSGRLRISAPVNFGNAVLSPVICALMQRYPKLEVQVELNDRFVDLIEEGFDVALRIRTNLPDSSLIARKLCRITRSVCAAPSYLKRVGAPRTPEELKNHACLIYSLSTSPFDWKFGAGNRTVTVRVNGGIQSNNGQFLMSFLHAGLGIALLPDFTVGEDIRSGRLKRLLETYPVDPHDLYVVYPANRHQSPKLRAFMEVATELLGGQCDRFTRHERKDRK